MSHQSDSFTASSSCRSWLRGGSASGQFSEVPRRWEIDAGGSPWTPTSTVTR